MAQLITIVQVHMSVPHVEQFVDLLVSIPAEGGRSSKLVFLWEIQGAYQMKVTTIALALLLLTRHVEFGNINSDTGITTRSRAKKLPDQWTVVPLPAKEDSDSDWDEAESEVESEDDDFLSSSAKSALHVRPTYEYLDAMAKAFNEDEEDDFEDELLSGVDPVNEISLVNILFESLEKFSEGDKPCFEHLFQSITKPQQEAMELLFIIIIGAFASPCLLVPIYLVKIQAIKLDLRVIYQTIYNKRGLCSKRRRCSTIACKAYLPVMESV
ncbi:elongation factor 2, partial [Striga asiatica]